MTGEKELLVLGADGTLGRDEFLRLLYGGRVSLQVAVLSMIGVTLIGVTLGAIAGYFRGTTDTVISRLTEVTMAFPVCCSSSRSPAPSAAGSTASPSAGSSAKA